MIKSELTANLANKLPSVPGKDIPECVDLVLNYVSEALSQGGRVEIRGFGSWCLHYQPPRNAHNPKTGERVKTPPKHRAHFKPGKELRERINASRAHTPIKGDDPGDKDDGDDGGDISNLRRW